MEFNIDNFEPGNMLFVGMREELIEETVNDAIEYIRRNYGKSLPVSAMDAVIHEFDIDYNELPHYLAAKFDEFDVY